MEILDQYEQLEEEEEQDQERFQAVWDQLQHGDQHIDTQMRALVQFHMPLLHNLSNLAVALPYAALPTYFRAERTTRFATGRLLDSDPSEFARR